MEQINTPQPSPQNKSINRKKEKNMENKQIIKDLTISVNRIKKARYTKHKQYQNYLQEVDTITILNTEFTKEQLQNIHQAYNIINQAKLKIANAKPTKAQQREQQLNKAYGTNKPHTSELPTETIETIKKKQENQIQPEKQPLTISKSEKKKGKQHPPRS